MPYNFDEIIERRGTDSAKWSAYPPDVIPMFVADMDFRSPEPVIRALRQRVEHGVFGYGHFVPPADLLQVLCERMDRLYGWKVEPGDFIFLPNLVSGLFMNPRVLCQPGEAVLVQPPVYWPFLMSADLSGHPLQMAPLHQVNNGYTMRYEIDFDAFEAAITPNTSLFILCNPHNPVGRVYERRELEKLAEICLRHNVLICSDEIHGDLIYNGHRHVPIASIAPEISANCVTLMAPSKTFNLPGLGLGFAIIQNAALRQRFKDYFTTMGVHVSLMGYVAAEAAYRHSAGWLAELMVYLEGNRDYLVDYVSQNFPGVHVTRPEGTYLAWLDFRESNIPGDPYRFFLDHARVALAGNWSRQVGEGYARLNYGTPRALLTEGLDRMAEALARLT